MEFFGVQDVARGATERPRERGGVFGTEEERALVAAAVGIFLFAMVACDCDLVDA